MFEAVVLAGGEKNDPLALREELLSKMFIPVQGRPLVGYILSALAGCPSIRKIIVVGPEKELNQLQFQGYSFTVVPEKGSMLDNAAAGLREVDQDNLCLLTTGDIPLANADMVESFIALCDPYEDDFYYPVITRQSCRQRFPQTRRTCVRLKEGSFTGGNLAMIRPSWFNRSRDRLETFITYRKHPLKLFRIMPFWFIIKFIFGRLSVADLEEYLSRILQLRARAVFCPFAELATDVDKESDLEVVNRELTGGC
ncbi:MAG TPA: NTP transferase domain-containing protein [Firmicutes bacterium]|nr:NTP transferase domain-containing protein [Bacillota bacterium]